VTERSENVSLIVERSAIPISTTMKHSPQQIAFNEVARQSIMADISWNNGDY
jgi:homoserine O-acetyltransferase